jgi:CheY-like chemotaxis protein
MMGLPRVLAVDDTPSNLLALDAVLSRNYALVEANSGTAALAILEHDTNFDVILLDVSMPILDGYETAMRIKKLAGCEDIPIVFITAVYSEDPYVKRGYAAGGIDYFTKPFDPDILRMKLDVYASFRQRAAILKARERQVRESEAVLRVGRKLASVLESLPVGVVIADASGRVCQMNEGALRLLKSLSAIETDAYGELLAWWERNEARVKHGTSPLSRALASGEPTHNQPVQLECVDGTMKNVLESTSPLRSLEGKIVGAVVVMQDVTEPKKYEADLEQRIAHLVSLGFDLERVAQPSHR